MKYKVITICGSGRFIDEMNKVEETLTMTGNIVFMLGVNTKDVARTSELLKYKPMLDEMHLRKIDLSDGIFVVNLNQYVGSSTRKEILYAAINSKAIDFLVPYFFDTKEKILEWHGIGQQERLSCPVCDQREAVTFHHIYCRGMGGTSNQFIHSPFNQIPICPECHDKYGDKKQHYAMLFDKLDKWLSNKL